MHIHRIDHVSLNVADRSRSLAWYAEVLGLRADDPHDVPDEPVFLGPAGRRLGLFGDRAPGLRHIALATDAAGQRALAARLDALGIAYRPERHADSDSLYFADPDGAMLEVTVPRAGATVARAAPLAGRVRTP
jgi:catechol 2,3-dioxygenase-like lactoylglutathione lyase family enzyme